MGIRHFYSNNQMMIGFIAVTKFLVLLLNVGVVYAANSSLAEAQGIERKRTLSGDDQSS